MTEYVSSVGGFAGEVMPNGGPGSPAAFYAGAAGSLPGVAGNPGFQVAVLFQTEGPATEETLWSAEDGVVGGWRISIRPSTVVNVPPNAIDIVVYANGVQTAVATVLNAQPAVPMLAHAFIFDNEGDLTASLFVNGTRAGTGAQAATPYVPSNAIVTVGCLAGTSQFATTSRVLGTMYHTGAPPTNVTPASFYTSCREAKDMVWGLDTVGGAPVTPNSDWTNRYSVREDIAASAVAPATWVPSTGLVNLALAGMLNVRAHKNLDWDAVFFATPV